MSLLPDPGELRAIAARIDDHAHAARTRAVGLADAIAATDWAGLAAGAFRGQAQLALSGLRSAAGRLDEAADALRRHADRVDGLLSALTTLVRGGIVTVEELLSLPTGAFSALLAVGPADAVRVLSTVRGVAGSALDAAGGALDAAGGLLDAVGL
jgi:uncharacterized protein YukE